MKKIAKRKVFDHKQYSLQGNSISKKSDATKRADRLRKTGNLVRVEEIDKRYYLYIRKRLLKPYGDIDGDGVINGEDCQPYNPKKQDAGMDWLYAQTIKNLSKKNLRETTVFTTRPRGITNKEFERQLSRDVGYKCKLVGREHGGYVMKPVWPLEFVGTRFSKSVQEAYHKGRGVPSHKRETASYRKGIHSRIMRVRKPLSRPMRRGIRRARTTARASKPSVSGAVRKHIPTIKVEQPVKKQTYSIKQKQKLHRIGPGGESPFPRK